MEPSLRWLGLTTSSVGRLVGGSAFQTKVCRSREQITSALPRLSTPFPSVGLALIGDWEHFPLALKQNLYRSIIRVSRVSAVAA